ncbi:MAG: hypothetical protein OXK80_04280 [Bdellovibrionales bacterium]|nr:hypothetical protein [Bdellovibrionales bacterium]
MSLKPSDLQVSPPESGEKFEKLCLDLYKAEFGDQTYRNGRSGQSQDGVDIFVQDKDIGIQCKKKGFNDQIKESELIEEVQKAKKFKPPLDRFILANTCKRDENIQKVARLISKEHKTKTKELFSVEIHSWHEIKALLDTHFGVFEKHFPEYCYSSQKSSSITPAIINSIQTESRHRDLNKIRDLINGDQPKTAFDLLTKFKKEKWEQLEDKEKYRVLTNMAVAHIRMKQETQASDLLIRALQFNKEDENANANCALAYLIIGDIRNSKKYIEKTKQLNPLSVLACTLEIQIQDKENQPLEDIISSIPKNMETKHQVAHILSQISTRRKQYAEVNKWLNIFYDARKKNGGWKDINDEADYADMSLNLILERQDVLSGRRIPDNLKDELEEIVKIYKKLVTDSQYSELKDFNPNWYLHYALALEVGGNLSGAVSILEEGVRKFSHDDHLKIELSRLLRYKGDILQSVSILEDLLGLTDDSLDSISKKSLSLNEINISEKSFNLALILTDLYFQKGQKENAQNLLHRIIESPSIGADDRLEVKQYSIFRMIYFREIDKAEEMLNLLFKKNNDDIFNLILKSKIEKAKERETSGKVQESNIHRSKKIQYLKKAYSVFKDKKYNDEIDQNNFYFKKKERLRDIEQLSKELYFSKMYVEVEPLLEEITNKNLNHPKVFQLLHTYFENGKNRLAIALAEELLKKFPSNAQVVHTLFLIYENLGDRKKAIQCYEDFLQSNLDNEFIKIELALAYVKSEYISKAKQLLESEFNLDQLSMEQTNRLSLAYMSAGSFEKALETQYKCIKENPSKMKPQSVYCSLFTFLNYSHLSDKSNLKNKSEVFETVEESKLDNEFFLNPIKAGLDCYVRIKDTKSQEEIKVIIEEDAKIYNLNHELSRTLSGKKEGDIIVFVNKEYQVMEIKSKYVHEYHKILKEAEQKFTSKTFLKSAHISPKADGKQILQTLKQMVPNLSNQEEDLNKLLQLYKEGEVTIGAIAKKTGKHPIDIIGILIYSSEDKFISAIPDWENYKKTKELLDGKIDILIDLSSLIMIHQLEIGKYLEESKFSFFICQSTMDSLKEYIRKTTLHSKDGLLTVGFDKEGNSVKNFINAQKIKQDLNFWAKVKIWIEEHCQIKPISADIVLSREEGKKREDILGKEFFDSLLALDDDVILLCEDAILRKYAEEEFSVSGIRLFDLIEYFERQIIIDNNQAVKFKAQLIRLNQTYISIDHKILLFLLKDAKCSVNDIGFQRGLYFLSSVSNLPGVISVIADFLIEIFQDSSLLFYNKQIITKELLDKSLINRSETSERIAHQLIRVVQVRTRLLPIHQNEICSHIMEWLKGRVY